ncbi:beta-galactosidase [Elsinoe ampelina]|uniref:Beta-galactosidase n=1 Tax=Elsinoe ampelina TaxID=302913 RepID=A0A6A6GKF4_9PEZI|nr:beta-galactosidase [Elsinoe ampelina]
MSPPYLQKTADTQQLIVNGEPFLMLAGELQNSSLTSVEYMRETWQKLKDTNVNTALGCVTWEMIEPIEDSFDFSVIDQIILDARSHDMHLVLLWFGSFKNGISTYAPGWVKKDFKRFPRAKLSKAGAVLETADVVSIFHTEAQRADAKAFAKLMGHLKDIDEAHSTVLMVQVENETGLLGDSRDRSPAAEARFSQPVPTDLLDFLANDYDQLHPALQSRLATFRSTTHTPGHSSWAEVFGPSPSTDELFMAYHYTLYLEQVASAGLAAYPIPLYTNVWQNYFDADADSSALSSPSIVGGGNQPGDYPSGGGVINVLDIWQRFAPSLSFIAPDVYLNDYTSSCEKYRHRNQALFIPEQRRDAFGARRIWTAYATFSALGVSPFGIDDERLVPATNPFTREYALLGKVKHWLLDAQRRPGSAVGFYFDEMPKAGSDPSPVRTVEMAGWRLKIERSFVFGHPAPGAGMVVHLEGDRFLLVGYGFQVGFESLSSKATFTGILNFEEKEVVGGTELKTRRRLNGDETRSGKLAIMPSEDPDYGGFPICVTIPAVTGIAVVEPYALEE